MVLATVVGALAIAVFVLGLLAVVNALLAPSLLAVTLGGHLVNWALAAWHPAALAGAAASISADVPSRAVAARPCKIVRNNDPLRGDFRVQ